MELKEKIISIIAANSNVENVKTYLQDNDNLAHVGINSLSFIKIIVVLESELGFAFEDSNLDYKKFTSLDLLCKYVEEQLEMQNNQLTMQ